ncbi:MAG: ice-binding family protein [Candidatus Eisenbacteria bacterium]
MTDLVRCTPVSLAATLLLLTGVFTPTPAQSQIQVTLGSAASYTILAASTITIAGATTIVGDVGLSPGTAISGMPAGQPTGGVMHLGDPTAAQAQADLGVAYFYLASLPCTGPMTGVDLGTQVLTPGVYCFDSSAQLTGVLTLDALGDTAAVFVFQVGSTLTLAGNSAVVLVNGARAANVWWQVGSSATLGIGSSLSGSVLAQASIGLAQGATVAGRLQVRTAAVTMDTNAITGFGGVNTLDAPSSAASGLRLAVAPSPAAGNAQVRWSLPAAGGVWLDVLDVQGRRVATLMTGESMAAGAGSRGLETQGWSPGVFLVRLRTAQGTVTQRVVVQR